MTIPLHVLREIGGEILEAFSNRSKDVLFQPMTDYHGFGKSPIHPSSFRHLSTANAIDPGLIQVDVVRVSTDLSNEVHFHAQASAYVVCLGAREGFSNPVNAMAFCRGSWRTVSAGSALNIPAGELHGFTVREGGVLYFLSVQSPPIYRGGGEDDYHRPETPPAAPR